MLFALLAKLRGPIATDQIEAVFSFNRKAEPAFPPCPVLTGIDDRVRRWLSIREDNGIRQFAFAHPRLAGAFAEALGRDAERAEDHLIEWMESAWHSEETRRGTKPGANYALDWLPEHLRDVGKAGEREAGALLSSPMFLRERLRDPRRASQRLRATLDLWNRLDQDVKDSLPGGRCWTAFWAENETALHWATAIAQSAGIDTARPLLRCLGDTATGGSEPTPPPAVACIAHPPPERGLIRSLDRAHAGWVRGVLPVGERLVSWGSDGAIRFWSLEGAALAGGGGGRPCVRGLGCAAGRRPAGELG
jgi:hypothetical protein